MAWEASPGGLLLAVGAAVLSASFSLALVWLGKRLVDLVVEAGRGPVTTGDYLPTVIGLALLGAGQRALGTIEANNSQRFAERVGIHADRKFVEKACTTDFAYFDDPTWHDRMSRASRDLQFRPVNLTQNVIRLLSAAVTVGGMLGVLLALHPLLIVLGLLSVLVALPFQRRAARQRYALYYAMTSQQRQASYVRSLLTEARPALEVRAFGLAPHLMKRFRRLADDWVRRHAAVLRDADRWTIVSSTLGAVALAGAYAFVAARGVRGQLTPGEVTATIGAIGIVTAQVSYMSMALVGIDENTAFLDDYFSFLALPPLLVAPDQPEPLPARLDRGVELEDVTFTYPGRATPALQAVSLCVRPGELLALVGDNGAGKTTLVKLLLRLHDPDAGSVRLGGVDLRHVEPSELRGRLGVLPQDYMTYRLTLRDNVVFGRVEREAGDEQVWAAIERARGRRLAERLPDGLDSVVGRLFEGGLDLSAGEWQRLALARLFFRDADVWVLDEPTSALDPEAEASIFAELRAELGERIGIVISHRFSTVRNADRIAVMSGGRVLEMGTHDELMASGGRYAQLFELQAAGYR